MVKHVTIENGKTYSFPDDATEQEINSVLPPSPNSTLDKLANNPITNFIVGAGTPANQFLTQGVNKLTGSNLQSPQFKGDDSFSGKAGRFAGDVGLIMGLGELGSLGMESTPLTKLASDYIPKALQRIAGMGAVGAVSDPNSKEGAETGTALQSALESIPYVGKGLAGAADYIKPKQYLGKILDNLSGGLKLEDNGKMLADNIKNAYNSAKEKGNQLYDSIFSNSGISDSDISNSRMHPIVGTSKLSNYEKLGNDTYGDYTGDTEKAHQAFTKNPTIENAHELQKKLGSEQGYWKRQDFLGNSEAREKLDLYGNARDTLKDDIKNRLNALEPGLSDKYEEASDYWKNNVIPFESDKDLKLIAKGKETNPTSSKITSIFQNPNENIQPVVDQIGNEGQKRILFNELGKTNRSKSVSDFLNATQQLDDKGMGSYLDNNEELKKQISSLVTRDYAKKGVEGILGLGLGSALAKRIPLVGGAAELGGAAAPFLLDKLGVSIPSIPGAGILSKAVANSYRPLGQSIVSQQVLNKGK